MDTSDIERQGGKAYTRNQFFKFCLLDNGWTINVLIHEFPIPEIYKAPGIYVTQQKQNNLSGYQIERKNENLVWKVAC